MLKHFWFPFPMSSTEFPLDYLLPLLKRSLNCWLFVFHDIYLLFMLCASRSKDKNCQPWFLRSRRQHSVKKKLCGATADRLLPPFWRHWQAGLTWFPCDLKLSHIRAVPSPHSNKIHENIRHLIFFPVLFCLTMSTLSWLLLFDLCKKIVNGKILGRDFFSLYFSINRIFITTQKASGFQLIDIFSI